MEQDKLKSYFNVNRELWNGWTEFHKGSSTYDIEGFKQGRSSLHRIEVKELGDVAGKKILHLQCHFGLDTLSWVRRGGSVTGIDFSDRAIKLARSLAKELDLNARFICSNIYDLKEKLDEKFDIVFTSYGILAWLPDLKKWADTIYHFLHTGGIFYIVEFHPILNMFNDDGDLQNSYFHREQPLEYECKGSYAAPQADFIHKAFEWDHPLSEVISSLTQAGLAINFLHEFPYTISGDFPFLIQGEDGLWRFKGLENKIPLMFSIKTSKQD
ncbi:MAG: class I SAM-dependent methyltransferase [bacterium]